MDWVQEAQAMLEAAPTRPNEPTDTDRTRGSRSPLAPPPRIEGTSVRIFDLWSAVYDNEWMQALTYRPVHDAVLATLRRAPRTAVLDIGCGTGLFTTRIAHELPDTRVVGCDFSRGMLGQARKSSSRVAWVQGNALELPFAPGSFDTVVSTEAFHWFPDPKAALAQLFEILAPQGQLMLALINPPSALVSDFARSSSRWIGDPLLWPTRSRMRGWLEGAGFDVELQRRIPRLPFGRVLPPVLSVATRPAR